MEGKLNVADMGFQNQEAYVDQENKYLFFSFWKTRKNKLLILEEGI